MSSMYWEPSNPGVDFWDRLKRLLITGTWGCLDIEIGMFFVGCRRLSLADRATMVPLLAAVVDFDATPETYQRYDSMTALELFQK